MEWTRSWRNKVWAEFDHPWDLIIIGGGITGAGILHRATHAKLHALLVEADDFASDTYSRSSKWCMVACVT
jgi:glycerol-3-phosphate dehydrogenase